MTLLLGPPSSGKSTLLLALAGKLDPQLKVTLPSLSHCVCDCVVFGGL
jgi:ABC-type multidrug transport system ATPase subunit